MPLTNQLLRRQSTFADNDNNDNNRDNDGYYDGFWYSSTAYIIKWAVIAAIFVLFIAFFVGGYFHARRRMKKGLAPLPYHRWMIPRRQRLAFYHNNPNLPNPYAAQMYGPQASYRPGFGDSRAHAAYPMAPMGPPPPAYGQDDWVPPYAPPEGASKINPDQQGPSMGVQQVGTTTGPNGAVGGGVGQGSGGYHYATNQSQNYQGWNQGQGQGHPGGDLGARQPGQL